MSFKREINVIERGGLCVNCRISRGQLVPAGTFIKVGTGISGKVKFAGYSKAAGRFFLCDGNGLFVSVDGNNFTRLMNLDGEYAFLIEEVKDGTPRAAVIGATYAVAHTGTSFTTFDVGQPLRCGVMHCGRLFGVHRDEGYKLCWSGEGGAGDRSEGLNAGGYLVLDPDRGEVSDILEYGEKLVLIRKYGLTVLNMFGSPENFSVGITDTDTDEIYAKTARVAGGKLLFFTSSGLCSYAGGAAMHINLDCGKITSPVCSAEFGGVYYLSCYSEKLAERVIFRYDTESGESCFINLAADAMCSAERLYAYTASGAHKLVDGGEYSFVGKRFDFGTGASKTLTSLYIEGKADVEVSNGRVTRTFSGASGVIRPRLRGKSFTVKVSGENAVTTITAAAEVLNEI